jgi:urea transporter
LQLLQGSVLGVAQVIAVNDFACSAVVVAGMLLSSPLLAITGYLGSLISTCMGKIL